MAESGQKKKTSAKPKKTSAEKVPKKSTSDVKKKSTEKKSTAKKPKIEDDDEIDLDDDEDIDLDEEDDDEEIEEDLDAIQDEMLADDDGDKPRSGDEVEQMLRETECAICTRKEYSQRLKCKVRKDYGCPKGKWPDE